MAAAEGGAEALRALTDTLAAAPPANRWPADRKEAWATGAELIFESADRTNPTPEQQALCDALMQKDTDLMVLRDIQSARVRRDFADYPDPAGLISALKLHDTSVAPSLIVRRIRLFEAFKEGTICTDLQQGVGRIDEVDGITNDVFVAFDRRIELPLVTALDNLVVVLPGSDLEGFLEGRTPVSSLRAGPSFRRLLENGLRGAVPGKADSWGEALMVPAIVDRDTYRTLLEGEDDREEVAVEGATRHWYDARSIDELVVLLTEVDAAEDVRQHAEKIEAILRGVCTAPAFAPAFAEAITRLRVAGDDTAAVDDMLRDLAPASIVWLDEDTFISVSDKIAGRLTPHWFAATAAAMGEEYLADRLLILPLRLWAHADKAMADSPTWSELLADTVRRAVRGGNVSTDVLLRLWKTESEDKHLLADPQLLFKTLGRPVRGSFIRSTRELHKLMMENPDFQRLLMRDGDPNGIAALVRAIRHRPLLDSGERQSLLVRIVRLFPEARTLVEERATQPRRRAIGKLTSARSYELRRRELQDIINVRIPRNSKAIGHARSYGDLRENAEYKAAKDEQRYLRARRAELERDLGEIKATDFSDVVVRDVVIPGCTVVLEEDTGETRDFHVLGLWDSAPELSTISYDTPLGRALLGGRVDDVVDMPAGHTATIRDIRELPEDTKVWLTGHDL